jgi:SAM-dependent methyltransferase
MRRERPSAPADSYDRVPYTNHAFAESHPDRLRVVARLSGWNPPALANARVLEVGCGRGGNLLAMAMSLPGATFVGIERSERQAAEARSLAERLGVTNVTIRAASFDRVEGEEGSFAFVIAHGIGSWIPPEDRRELLRRVAGWLSQDGVGYVSFNVLPGWYERLAARDWLRFGAGIGARPSSAAASLEWLRKSVSPELASYKDQLARVEARLLETSPAYAAHEYLEGDNHPQLVSDFLREATTAGLAYLGDAIPSAVAIETLPEPSQGLAQTLDAARAQQLVDFIRCTSFRRALLVRNDTCDARGWRWPARLDPKTVPTLHLASRLRPSADQSLFSGPGGSVQVTNPLARSVLGKLAEAAPRALSFAELAGDAPAAACAELASEIKDLWLSVDGIDLHDHDPPFAPTVSERPRACPLARWQVVRGEPVTNRWHQEVRLPEPAVRAVLSRADGTRTVSELAEAIGCNRDLAAACLELLARSALLVE